MLKNPNSSIRQDTDVAREKGLPALMPPAPLCPRQISDIEHTSTPSQPEFFSSKINWRQKYKKCTGLSALMPLAPLCPGQTWGDTFFAGFHIEEDKSLDVKMVCVILSNIVYSVFEIRVSSLFKPTTSDCVTFFRSTTSSLHYYWSPPKNSTWFTFLAVFLHTTATSYYQENDGAWQKIAKIAICVTSQLHKPGLWIITWWFAFFSGASGPARQQSAATPQWELVSSSAFQLAHLGACELIFRSISTGRAAVCSHHPVPPASQTLPLSALTWPCFRGCRIEHRWN